MKELLKTIPSSPGVYKMKDAEGRVLYVGKAKDLKKRVNMYFKPDYQHSYRTRTLVSKIADIECIETDSELEALILENTIIKQLKPKYNILMKDDKSYVYVKIDTREDFPRVRVLREHSLEHAGKEHGPVKYFGPKLASSYVYDTLTILKKLFPYRHCNLDIAWKGSDQDAQSLGLNPDQTAVTVTNKVIDFPCLDYHIKRCPGPCIGATTPEEYGKMVKAVMDFFAGRSDAIITEIETQMNKAAQEKRFEKAAKLRDKLLQIKSLTERQKMSDPSRVDTDVIHATAEMGHLYYSILLIRKGKIIDQQQFVFDAFEVGTKGAADEPLYEPVDEMEYFESFLKQYYSRTSEIPKEVIIPTELEEQDVVESWLSTLKGNKVTIIVPQKGEKNQLLELAHKNAVTFAKQHRIKWLAEKQHEKATEMLAQSLGMPDAKLKRIEGYDISHLAGNETVGSMVVFTNGAANSNDYRHFKMRTVVGKPNDFKSMEEVLTRRLKYLSFEQEKKGMRIALATKKDLKTLTITEKNTFIAKMDKKPAAWVTIEKCGTTFSALTQLWFDTEVSQETVGFSLLDKVAKKEKQKKFYIIAQENTVDFFAHFGATELLKHPDELAELAKKNSIKKPIFMVYEIKKRAKMDPSFAAKPDLILIDGGKGQLGVAAQVLKKYGMNIPVISLAKKLEEIFVPDSPAPILLDETNEALKLLQHIRDESHRFAITFQRKLHVKGMYT